jgi:hypothetical protein
MGAPRGAPTLAGRGELSRNLLRPYARPHVYDVLDWRDPAPFAKLMKDWAQNRNAESGETEERPTVGLAPSARRFSRGGNSSTATGSRPRFAA